MTHVGGGYTCKNCGTYHRTTVVCNCKKKTNNMEQQTAVDWLVEQLQAPCRGIPSHIIEQAKEIHRKQIIQSFRIGKQNGYESGTSENFRNLTAEEYYKETYLDQL